MIAQVRETDARIRLISDGDVAGAIAAARPEEDPRASPPRPRCAAWAGVLQARLAPTDDTERQTAIDAGHDLAAS